MSRIVRWTGGPGAGKTYQLLADVQEEVKEGWGLADLTLSSFSRAQADDFARRLHETVFPRHTLKEVRERCATVDAAALRVCRAAGLIPDPRKQIIQRGGQKTSPAYIEFMRTRDDPIPFDPRAGEDDGDDDPLSRSELPAGNQIYEIGAYLAATMTPVSEWRDAAAAIGLALNAEAWGIESVLAEWQEYKAKHELFEHADYVRLCLDEQLEPPTPILIIDEYQDVSPLQNAQLQQWMDHPDTERVYIAGDPDQSIYGFRGCDPDFFCSIPAEDRGATGDTRPVSHRCPAPILRVAEDLLGHQANVSPNNRRGLAHRADLRATEDLARQIEIAVRANPSARSPVYVLSRFRRHVSAIARELAAVGIPSKPLRKTGVTYWGDVRIGRTKEIREDARVNIWDLSRAIRRYMYEEYESYPAPEARALVRAAFLKPRRDELLKEITSRVNKSLPIRIVDLQLWVGAERHAILDALNLPPKTLEQIRRCMVREAQRGFVITPDQVRFGTIHAAKGMQAPVVLLHTGYLDGIMANLTDPLFLAEERRVYFVGASRASRALITFDHIHPICPLFGGVV